MRQQPPPALDARISQALGNSKASADDLETLIPAIETGIAEADATARRERARALDVADPDADEAGDRANVAELQRARLEAALPRVRQKLADALRTEHEDRWQADANRAAVAAAAAAERLAGYQKLAEQMVILIAEADAANREVSRVNGCAPDDVHRRVEKVDLAHLKNLVLPDPANPARNLWPPHQPSFAASYAATMAPVHDSAYSADWAKARQANAEAVREGSERLARYHAEAGRREEERINREERERFGRR